MEKKTNILKNSIYITVALFILATVYTLFINGFAQLFFKESANGSIIEKNGEAIGSKHIGQNFTSPKYFHGRPSAVNYNSVDSESEINSVASSGGSNLAMSNPKLNEEIKANVEKLLSENPDLDIKDVPSDLVTASASGLDPDISVEGAMLQADRVAKENGVAKEKVVELINRYSNNGIVNVLQLNLALMSLTE